ncbi:hypothetical protein M9H77_17584 [Catharanthus roseus]|uniref:Uncharacterized protein n=1 Tax=Catharanthus roseus TaxID=4058 RepID=A0ACC0B525_CATRO|nr:hypothetical protein M9H77_17584 [Catharanthus roseus]
MVKVKNANIGRGENYEGGSSRGGRAGKGKGKKVASEVKLPERFISIKEAANFEEWARKMRKIAPGHRVDLFDMKGMEIIPNLFENIGWRPLFTVNELYNLEMIYEFYANLHEGRVQKQGNIIYQWVTSSMGSRDISFDDRMLNTILGTSENATQNSFTKCFPYGCFFTNVFQYFLLNLVRIGDHIGIRKIYNKHTFKRMGFSRNEEDMLVRGGQEDDDEEEDEEEDEGQDAMNVDEEVSEEEPEEENLRREMRQKKRQERVEEGQSSGDVS